VHTATFAFAPTACGAATAFTPATFAFAPTTFTLTTAALTLATAT
jgi:hypothetical protein